MGWVCDVPNTWWRSSTTHATHASMMPAKDGSIVFDDELQAWLDGKGEEYDTWVLSCFRWQPPGVHNSSYVINASIWFKHEMDALEFKLMWQ